MHRQSRQIAGDKKPNRGSEHAGPEPKHMAPAGKRTIEQGYAKKKKIAMHLPRILGFSLLSHARCAWWVAPGAPWLSWLGSWCSSLCWGPRPSKNAVKGRRSWARCRALAHVIQKPSQLGGKYHLRARGILERMIRRVRCIPYRFLRMSQSSNHFPFGGLDGKGFQQLQGSRSDLAFFQYYRLRGQISSFMSKTHIKVSNYSRGIRYAHFPWYHSWPITLDPSPWCPACQKNKIKNKKRSIPPNASSFVSSESSCEDS